ncbi:MAG: esterase/lipase family protein [Leucothrix sp.]
MTKPDVLLLHGVLVNAMEMLYLKRQLEQQGFTVHSLSYASTKYSIAENAQRLYQQIASIKYAKLHVVAHSLGGIMTLHLLEKYPDLKIGRVVMLGTPINGSYAAKRFCRWKVIGRLLTNSMAQGLAGDHHFNITAPHEIGMIAGSIQSPIGLGLLLGKLPEANDGTVLLSETKHPLLSQHLVVNKSHTGLVFSKTVAALASRFLRTGHFEAQHSAL